MEDRADVVVDELYARLASEFSRARWNDLQDLESHPIATVKDHLQILECIQYGQMCLWQGHIKQPFDQHQFDMQASVDRLASEGDTGATNNELEQSNTAVGRSDMSCSRSR